MVAVHFCLCVWSQPLQHSLKKNLQNQEAEEGSTVTLHAKLSKYNAPVTVTEHRNRLPREAVESPSLEILKTRLDKVLSSLL